MRYQYFESPPGSIPPKKHWRQWVLAVLLLAIIIIAGVWIGRLIPQAATPPQTQDAFFEGYYTLNAILDKSLQQRFPVLEVESVELQPGGISVHNYRLPQNTSILQNDIQDAVMNTVGGYGFTIISSNIQREQWHFSIGADSTIWADLVIKLTAGDTEAPATTALPTGLKRVSGRARIAIVIDDFGYAYNRTIQGFMKMSEPLNYSIIPKRPYSTQIAQQLHQANKTIMIHMPMETITNSSSEPALVIKPGLSDVEVEERLQEAYQSVPHAMGLNNHQGSGATQDADLMASVMRWLREKNLWFVDSRTIAATVAEEVARKSGIKTVSRDVFLDDVDDVSAIKKELIHLANIAAERGAAVAIGHCRPNTLAALESYLPLFRQAGYEIVPVTQLLR
ncbi:MAG: divergent polysaccharide deacetylase family protein [Lentisphaeria bacterium]|nr:divergent polysaccharide deacetylase family protein [Candidatus Neomarinimicrobiota bacterium]MCF7841704.1 divergent polysaccharide deacetylase family protein [Lentisphaeria bacterium]